MSQKRMGVCMSAYKRKSYFLICNCLYFVIHLVVVVVVVFCRLSSNEKNLLNLVTIKLKIRSVMVSYKNTNMKVNLNTKQDVHFGSFRNFFWYKPCKFTHILV